LGAMVDFFAGVAAFLAAGAAFFTTGAAFFFVGAGRFVAVATTVAEVFLFPAREDVVAADRDAGARLTWAPLLAGVIVPSFGPRQWPVSPKRASPGERVTIPEWEGQGQQARLPLRDGSEGAGCS
jgi:hypothetical protein